jgi:hypothetical protein
MMRDVFTNEERGCARDIRQTTQSFDPLPMRTLIGELSRRSGSEVALCNSGLRGGEDTLACLGAPAGSSFGFGNDALSLSKVSTPFLVCEKMSALLNTN